MARFLKAVGRVALVVLGIKLLEQLLKNKKREKPCRDPRVTIDQSNARYIPSQLIVWKRPGVSDADFNQWKTDQLNQYPGLLAKKLCAHCDDSLELWEGDNVSTFISEKAASAGGSPPGPPPSGGGDAIACYSYNLIIDLPEPAACIPPRQRGDKLPTRPSLNGPAITVAVFDTGLLPLLKGAYTGTVPSCMPGGNLGWNFAYKNNVTDDDYPSEHGSAVAKFIIDQEDKYQLQNINILPVKVHNSSGKSDLFSILCGFAYAANCGAKIVNASFGFYTDKKSQAPAILTQFVKKHLTDRNILLVAAAGNVNADESVGRSEIAGIRDLDRHPFFPACLSKEFENVLAVTTVSTTEGDVSPSQNYSNRVVDVGVDCDAVLEADYRFDDPLGRGLSIIGSSYATPIVTGKIAQYYKQIMIGMPSGVLNKGHLLQRMSELGIMKQDSRLTEYIRDGNYTTK